MRTTVYIIRHAEAEGNVYRRCHGQYNALLTTRAYKQLPYLAKRFENVPLAAVYSSDLFRARVTAQAVAEPHHLSVETRPVLREIDMGDWEDIPWAELPHTWPEQYALWCARPWEAAPPHGETVMQAGQRMLDGVRAIVRENEGKEVAVVTHGSAIRGMLTIAHGFAPEQMGEIGWGDNTCVAKLEFDENGNIDVVYENDASHLPQIGGSANSVGTTLAPYFVTGVVFGGLSMEDIQIDQLMVPFLALMAVISLIVLLLMKLSLPDIQGTRVEKGEKLEKSVWSFRHLTLGVVAIFFYVGVEVCIGANINLYAIEMDYASPALMATLYWGGMLVGRLVGSSLSRISPRVQLTVTTVSAGLLALLAILLNNPWLLTAVGLFHSIMWGAIFTLSVAHLGKYTSVASGVFMIGVVGGAILPLLQGVLADVLGGWRWSWLIVLFGEAFMLYYALIGSRVRQTCDNL